MSRLLVSTTAIFVTAVAAAWLLRRSRASLRAAILASAFAACLLVPVGTFLGPALRIYLPVASSSELIAPLFTPPAAPSAAAVPAGPTRERAPGGTFGFVSLLTAAWLLGSFLAALPVVAVPWHMRQMRRHSSLWPEQSERARLLSARGTVDVRLTDGLATPMTGGWYRASVLFPREAEGWPDADIHRALLHELEHVRRADWIVQVLARVGCALYWFHPLVWFAWRRLRLECEHACDDAVVREEGGAAYAKQLVQLARRSLLQPAGAFVAMARRHELQARVDAALDPRRPRGHAGKLALLPAAALGLMAWVVTSVQIVAVTAQDAPTAARFEVTSVKGNESRTSAQRISTAGPNRLAATNVTVEDLIAEAFGKQSSNIVNLPGWAKSRKFDVQGDAGAAADWPRLMLMTQSLLADRFQFVSHREMRDGQVYALVVDAKGPRLTAVGADSCTPDLKTCGGFRADPGRLTGRRVTTEQLAKLLSGPRTGRLVVDRTNLPGFFDVELSWTPDGAGPNKDGAPAPEPFGASIFTAVREQLGLRLDSSTAPTEILVVDRIGAPEPD